MVIGSFYTKLPITTLDLRTWINQSNHQNQEGMPYTNIIPGLRIIHHIYALCNVQHHIYALCNKQHYHSPYICIMQYTTLPFTIYMHYAIYNTTIHHIYALCNKQHYHSPYICIMQYTTLPFTIYMHYAIYNTIYMHYAIYNTTKKN